MSSEKIFLNGELVEGSAVNLGLRSAGFAFGFGVFETMKFLGGKPCFFEEHLERLRKGAAVAGLELEESDAVLRERAEVLFRENAVEDGVFKLILTKGEEGTQSALFVRTRGVEEAGIARLRMSRVVKASAAFTSRYKSTNYMESVLELEAAKWDGYTECVFQNERGELTECAVANLFLVTGGVLRTPQLDCGLLDGIVRKKLIQIAGEMGVTVEEGVFGEADLLGSDEVFLSSSGAGPRSAESFVSLGGERADYQVELLPRLRERYLELERESCERGGR